MSNKLSMIKEQQVGYFYGINIPVIDRITKIFKEKYKLINDLKKTVGCMVRAKTYLF